jgi:beta-galactosidase
VLSKIAIPFGIRTIAATTEKGFLLNGKPVKLKGGCIHHDNGLLGAAAFDRAEEKKAELLKANGYNAVRCSHNQVSEHFLNSCDRLGILVIHETFDQWQRPKKPNDYSRFFDEWSDSDMAASVRRDRNHPSIIMWSIANEVEQRADSIGVIIAKRLTDKIREYDNTRFTTMGANDFWDRRQFTWDKDSYRAFLHVTIAGYNYMWGKYESDHAAYPARVMVGTESYPKEAANYWNLVEKHPYVIGDFVWTAIDYLGETGLGHTRELEPGQRDPQKYGWPWYNAWCGDIDICGEKKPQSYYRDILWRERAISMAVHPPVAAGKREVVSAWGWQNEHLSWSWAGLEGKTMKINVYSRSPKVQLYLNNRLIGEKETDKNNYTATFEVPYEPGELKAVNVSKNKEAVTLKTAGKPAAIRLSADRNRIRANKDDLSYIKIEITDKDGNLVPDAVIPVEIKCSGNGKVIASGNGGYDDMKSFGSLKPDTFYGKALAIVQPTEEKGTIQLSVSSPDMAEAVITIETY